MARIFADVPFGMPEEPLAGKVALGLRVPLYGLDQWNKLFTSRQLASLGTFVMHIRSAKDAMQAEGYPSDWTQALVGYLAMTLDRLVDRVARSVSPTQVQLKAVLCIHFQYLLCR